LEAYQGKVADGVSDIKTVEEIHEKAQDGG
jgi:hypothetical protein